MKYFTALLLAIFIGGCSWTTQEENPMPVDVNAPGETTWVAPDDYRTDEETWSDTTGRRVILKGCKEWKERNPDADC